MECLTRPVATVPRPEIEKTSGFNKLSSTVRERVRLDLTFDGHQERFLQVT